MLTSSLFGNETQVSRSIQFGNQTRCIQTRSNQRRSYFPLGYGKICRQCNKEVWRHTTWRL